jgi:phage shock protein C
VDSKIAGVCGGIGEYFDIDPTFVRIIAVVMAFAHGIGIVAYIVAWIAMPLYPLNQEPPPPVKRKHRWNSFIIGIALVIVGTFFLIDDLFWWLDIGDIFWPLLLIAAGLLIVFRRTDKTESKEIQENNLGSTGEVNNVG